MTNDVANDPTSNGGNVHVFPVPDISCGHCVSAITEQVETVDGVTSLDVNLDKKLVTVTGGDATAIVAAIDEAGYDVA